MKIKIAFCGGGTGGHVFPALAVIDRLSTEVAADYFWIGSRQGLEKKIILKHNLPYYGITAGKLRRYLSLKNFFDLFRVLAGVGQSLFLLSKLRPSLLFSKGGYVTVPPVIACRLLGIPVLTHESDYDPGLATRINSHLAQKILLSYAESKDFFPPHLKARTICTGNPVRPAIYRGDALHGKRLVSCPSKIPLILVLGGSLGAQALNRLIWAIKDELTQQAFVVHQTGPGSSNYENKSGNYVAKDFFYDELPHLLAAASLVISRAGANSLSELAALGKASILIPLPLKASRGDQLRNAQIFARRQAALVLPEEDASPQKLLALIKKLLANKEMLKQMEQAALSLSQPKATEKICQEILKILSSRKNKEAKADGNP